VLDSYPTTVTSSNVGGAFRYMAPEQFEDDNEGRIIQSDIYSYASTYAEVGFVLLWFNVTSPFVHDVHSFPLLQIMIGEDPFNWHKTNLKVLHAIISGELPYNTGSIISRHNIDFLERCWVAEPARRPTISDICHILGIILEM
jgi:serine/threonine protein kinase